MKSFRSLTTQWEQIIREGNKKKENKKYWNIAHERKIRNKELRRRWKRSIVSVRGKEEEEKKLDKGTMFILLFVYLEPIVLKIKLYIKHYFVIKENWGYYSNKQSNKENL